MDPLEIIKLYRMKPVNAQAAHDLHFKGFPKATKTKTKPMRRPSGFNEKCAVCKRSVFLLDLQNHLNQHFNIVFISEPGASFSDQLDSLKFFKEARTTEEVLKILESEVENYVVLANQIYAKLKPVKRGNVPDDIIREVVVASELASSLKYEVSVIKKLFPKDDQHIIVQTYRNVFDQRHRLTSAIVSRLLPKMDHEKIMACYSALFATQEEKKH